MTGILPSPGDGEGADAGRPEQAFLMMMSELIQGPKWGWEPGVPGGGKCRCGDRAAGDVRAASVAAWAMVHPISVLGTIGSLCRGWCRSDLQDTVTAVAWGLSILTEAQPQSRDMNEAGAGTEAADGPLCSPSRGSAFPCRTSGSLPRLSTSREVSLRLCFVTPQV